MINIHECIGRMHNVHVYRHIHESILYLVLIHSPHIIHTPPRVLEREGGREGGSTQSLYAAVHPSFGPPPRHISRSAHKSCYNYYMDIYTLYVHVGIATYCRVAESHVSLIFREVGEWLREEGRKSGALVRSSLGQGRDIGSTPTNQ